MKFQIGDKVKFLNEVGEGEIVSVIDKSTVFVRTADGFEIPIMISELVIDPDKMPHKREKEEKYTVVEKTPKDTEYKIPDQAETSSETVDEEIVFALIQEKMQTDIVSYIVNASTYHLYYIIAFQKEGENLFFAGGLLEPDTKVETGKIVPDKIDSEISISINLLFFGRSFYKQIKPLNLQIKVNPSEIYKGTLNVENDYFEEKASLYNLYSFKKSTEEKFQNISFTGNLEDLIMIKEQKTAPVVSKKAVRNPEIQEVDLHIESITDDFHDLDNSEIIKLQMARFQTSLETAIIHKVRRVVFIHGVGAGKLKHEIRRTLDRNFPDLKYQDASFSEYGYGATMVILPV